MLNSVHHDGCAQEWMANRHLREFCCSCLTHRVALLGLVAGLVHMPRSILGQRYRGLRQEPAAPPGAFPSCRTAAPHSPYTPFGVPPLLDNINSTAPSRCHCTLLTCWLHSLGPFPPWIPPLQLRTRSSPPHPSCHAPCRPAGLHG